TACDILQDTGAISMIASGDGLATGGAADIVAHTFRIARDMKVQRGRLPQEAGENDNFRVKRYLAKITINPAIAYGLDEWVGSVEVAKLADLVLWSPAFFGVKPDRVIKLGVVAAHGRAETQPAVTFVSQ